jgi:hypothetical protein
VKRLCLRLFAATIRRKIEEAYYHYAICMTTKTLLYSKEMTGLGSNPFVCFSWGKCAGEIYGRGPLLNALSAIKTTNLTIELILENAQMSISGIYQMEDDGVINPDTINLCPAQSYRKLWVLLASANSSRWSL